MKLPLIILTCFLLTACSGKPNAYDNHGKAIYFSHYQGKWVVLNYWASWCKPCAQEIPQLNQFYQKYHQQVAVFGINFDGTDTQQNIQKMHIQFPTLMENNVGQYFGIQQVSGLPTTYIINPEGKIAKVLQGEQTLQSLKQAIGLS